MIINKLTFTNFFKLSYLLQLTLLGVVDPGLNWVGDTS